MTTAASATRRTWTVKMRIGLNCIPHAERRNISGYITGYISIKCATVRWSKLLDESAAGDKGRRWN